MGFPAKTGSVISNQKSRVLVSSVGSDLRGAQGKDPGRWGITSGAYICCDAVDCYLGCALASGLGSVKVPALHLAKQNGHGGTIPWSSLAELSAVGHELA